MSLGKSLNLSEPLPHPQSFSSPKHRAWDTGCEQWTELSPVCVPSGHHSVLPRAGAMVKDTRMCLGPETVVCWACHTAGSPKQNDTLICFVANFHGLNISPMVHSSFYKHEYAVGRDSHN